MPSQKGHKYWTQLPTTIKLCQIVPHMDILKANKFHVWKTNRVQIVKLLAKNRGNRRKFEVFLRGGSKFERFWNLTYSTYLYFQNRCCVKIWVKMKQISWFYGVFCFNKFWPEEFYSSCNAPYQIGHKVWTQPPSSMKFCKNMPYMYISKVKKFWGCAFLRLDSIKGNIVGAANLHHPSKDLLFNIQTKWFVYYRTVYEMKIR